MRDAVLREFTLVNTAAVLGADTPTRDVVFNSISTDTRTLQAGALFIALRGPNFDGNTYVAAAAERGAVAALVDRAVSSNIPTLQVSDTRLALGALGAARRAAYQIPLVAVTGSNGKTSVKEMIGHILSEAGGNVLVTQGNLNNDLGVPQMLLRLTAQHTAAVIEMGANHLGEIAYLTQLARPTVALINNADAAHLEGFGSLDGVAQAKGEIYDGLGEHGIAIINANDRYADYWRGLNRKRKMMTFGINVGADVEARKVASTAQGCQFELHTAQGSTPVQIGLLGQHNVMNALAAGTAALAMGAHLADVARGLASMTPVKGRLQAKRARQGATVIDDTYNANPASLRAGIQVLKAFDGTRILVLGDMGELGPDSAHLHADAGGEALAAGIDKLFAVGKLSAAAVARFGAHASHFADQAGLIAALADELKPGVTLLVKGSRSSRMENVVAALLETA
ncbi:MAG: UDP-N-acetylmuramoyl-tripeptide--D-alanyl-D-alanine ligase [Gammaproteobacteria bacterium]|nr:UDP-N-acetylmuramoyl-tripeptide--D-alanyl-D-alanine ligase [Gammaproteobacteria bacterium]